MHFRAFSFAALAAVAPLVVAAKDCAGKVVNWVVVENTPDPTPANPGQSAPMSCSFLAEPADASGRAPYTVNGLAVLRGWEWYQACPVAAKQLGFVIPATKITGDDNNATMSPRLVFYLDTAPLLGRGSGHYADPFQAGIMSVFRKAYIVGVAG